MTRRDCSRRSFLRTSVALVGTTPLVAGLLHAQSNEASGPLLAYVSVHPSGRFLLVANYFGGSVAVLPILPDGRLGNATDIKRDAGKIGPTKATNATPVSAQRASVAPDATRHNLLACNGHIDQRIEAARASQVRKRSILRIMWATGIVCDFQGIAGPENSSHQSAWRKTKPMKEAPRTHGAWATSPKS